MEQEFKIPQERKKSFLISASVYFLFFIGFVILGIYVWQDPSSSSFRKYIFIPWFTFTTFYSMVADLYNGLFMKMTINQDHIKYAAFGIIIISDWTKLIAIEDYGIIFKNFEGISIRTSSVKKNILGIFLERPRYIPIYRFGQNWRDSELGQQIKQYAPHLFEKEKSA